MINPNPDSDQKKDKRFVLEGKALSVSLPCVMGILNLTPDSFYDGGRVGSVKQAMKRIEEMIEEGAAMVDIGGESTRPGSDAVSAAEEIRRVIPVVKIAVQDFPDTLFSVDTTKYEVAHRALDCGVHLVNDVSGLQRDSRLADLAGTYQAGLVIMHSKGLPKNMQDEPQYEQVTHEVMAFLKSQSGMAEQKGIKNLIVDPGIGFGKTLSHNLELTASLAKFTRLGYPVMVGYSRKSMIGQILADEKGLRKVEERLAGSLALQYHALINGVSILRVHDIRAASDLASIFRCISSAAPGVA